MAGRTPVKVYLYDKTGKFINNFESSSAFAKAIGENKNYLSNNNKEIGLTKDGNVFAISRIGKKAVKDYLRVQESPFVMKNNTKGTPSVVAYNLEGEAVMTFKNDYIARKVFPGLTYGSSGKGKVGLRFEREI